MNAKAQIEKLGNKIVEKSGVTGLKIRKKSPEILLGLGIVGVGATVFMACKATLKVNDILEEHANTVEKVKESIDEIKNDEILSAGYSEEDEKRDMSILKIQTGVKIAKTYAPVFVLGAMSITSILASHNIMSKRNAALGAAYVAVDTAFKDYRDRVIEKFGEEVDKDIRTKASTIVVEEKTTDDEGNEKTANKEVKVAGPVDYSEYARIFDENHPYWKKSHEANILFLKCAEREANDRLRAQGYLFLNDVYKMLGFPLTQAGNVVGWVYRPEDKTKDCFVDFGLSDIYNEKVRDFINGYEPAVWLDFNPDGIIYNDPIIFKK